MDMKIPEIKVDCFESLAEESFGVEESSLRKFAVSRNAAAENERCNETTKQTTSVNGILQDASPKTEKMIPMASEDTTRASQVTARASPDTVRASQDTTRASEDFGDREGCHGRLTQLVKSEIHTVKLEGSQQVNGNDIVSSTAHQKASGRQNRCSIARLSLDHKQNNVEAIVSPLLLRRHRNNQKRTSVNISPRKGQNNLIEIASLSEVKSPKLCPRIKSDWVVTEDPKISPNLGQRKETYAESRRKNRYSLDNWLPKHSLSTDPRSPIEEKFLKQQRPRSQSLSFVKSKETEPDETKETNIRPSMHWKIARDYMTAKSLRLPELVQLYRKQGLIQKASKMNEEKFIMPNIEAQSEREQIQSLLKDKKNKLFKSKSEDFFSSDNEADEILYARNIRSMSLHERLEAIEKRHGIVHEDYSTGMQNLETIKNATEDSQETNPGQSV